MRMDITSIMRRHSRIPSTGDSPNKCDLVPWRDNIEIEIVTIKVKRIKKCMHFIQLENQYIWIVLMKDLVSYKKVIKL